MEYSFTERGREILEFAAASYRTEPDYPWIFLPGYAILRHSDTRKWYALIMDVPRERLGLSGNGSIDILNVKCDPILGGSLRMEKGFLPAYICTGKTGSQSSRMAP